MKLRKTWTWTWGKMRPDKAATYAGSLKRQVGSFEDDVPKRIEAIWPRGGVNRPAHKN
jgi:hypothetical protein